MSFFSREAEDLTTGPLLKRILLFVVPVVLTSLFQLVYNTADLLVVNYVGGGLSSMSAIGDNWPINNILINTFVMVSVGVNVVVAEYRGKGKEKEANATLSSALRLSLFIGLPLAIIGFFLAPTLESLMMVPTEIRYKAALYLGITMLGVPLLLQYNFLTAGLRGLGDSKTPFLILLVCGALNVGLNFLLVHLLHNVFKVPNGDIIGVASATVICQLLEALSTLFALLIRRKKTGYGLSNHEKWDGDKAGKILRHGLPSGAEMLLFAISNVAISAEANLLGAEVVSGVVASANIEGYIYASLEAFVTAEIAIVAQNAAKKEYGRVRKSLLICLGLIVAIGAIMGAIAVIFRESLIGIYIPKTEENGVAFRVGVVHLTLLCSTYILCAFMDAGSGFLRGLGHPIAPTVVIFVSACFLRLVYVYGVFHAFFYAREDIEPWQKDLILYASYPICWLIASFIDCVLIPIILKKDGIVKGKAKRLP